MNTERLIYEELINSFLEEDNTKINLNANCSLDEYLNSFKSKFLERNLALYYFEREDVVRFFDIDRKKKCLIEEITKNFEEILKTFIRLMKKDTVTQLRYLIKKEGNITYEIAGSDNFNFSIHFLRFLKGTFLAKVYYDNKSSEITIFMQKDVLNALTKLLENKKLQEENKTYNNIFSFTEHATTAYGILTLDELFDLHTKFYKNDKMSIEKFDRILQTYTLIDDGFYIHMHDEELICNLEFVEESEAIDFYESTTGDINKKLTLKDITALGDNTYMFKLKSYKKLIDWLDYNYEGIKEDPEYINNFIIGDFLSSAQTSIAKAESNFRNNINEVLEIDPIMTNRMLIMLKNIYAEFPKWSKKGNI